MIRSDVWDHQQMMANEAPDVRELRRKAVKARTRHTCNDCKQSIEPGDNFVCTVYLVDGKIETHKECGVCRLRDWSAE